MTTINKSSLVVSLLAIMLLLVLNVGAFAQDTPPPPPAKDLTNDRPGPPPQLTPEQQALSLKLLEEHFAKARPIRENLSDQELVYDALVGNQNASVSDIQSVVSEMRKLRDQLYQLRVEYKDAYDKSGLPSQGHRFFHQGGGFHPGDGCFYGGGDDGSKRHGDRGHRGSYGHDFDKGKIGNRHGGALKHHGKG
jgi:hypothetical protein